MSLDKSLPFEVGQTYFESAPQAATADAAAELLGRIVYHKAGNGVTQKLRIVQNSSGSNLNRGRGVRMTTAQTLADFGKVAGYVNAAGAKGFLIHDTYATGKDIADNDFFYIVEEGPAHGTIGVTGATFGLPLAFNAAGKLTRAISYDWVVAESMKMITPAATGGQTLVRVVQPYKVIND